MGKNNRGEAIKSIIEKLEIMKEFRENELLTILNKQYSGMNFKEPKKVELNSVVLICNTLASFIGSLLDSFAIFLSSTTEFSSTFLGSLKFLPEYCLFKMLNNSLSLNSFIISSFSIVLLIASPLLFFKLVNSNPFGTWNIVQSAGQKNIISSELCLKF